jgi:hypothetical protein
MAIQPPGASQRALATALAAAVPEDEVELLAGRESGRGHGANRDAIVGAQRFGISLNRL